MIPSSLRFSFWNVPSTLKYPLNDALRGWIHPLFHGSQILKGWPCVSTSHCFLSFYTVFIPQGEPERENSSRFKKFLHLSSVVNILDGCKHSQPSFFLNPETILWILPQRRQFTPGIPNLQRIYKMDSMQLKKHMRFCAMKKRKEGALWEAFMYTMALHRASLTAAELSTMFYSLAIVGKRDRDFIEFMLEIIPSIRHTFTLRDIAVMLVALSKLYKRHETFMDSLLPLLLNQITETSPEKELVMLAFACTRMGTKHRDVLFGHIAACLSQRLDTLKNTKSLTLLLWSYSVPYVETVSSLGQTLARIDQSTSMCFSTEIPSIDDAEEGEVADVSEESEVEGVQFASISYPMLSLGAKVLPPVKTSEVRHRLFIMALMEQCLKGMANFKGKDLVYILMALRALHQQDEESLPPEMLQKVQLFLSNTLFALRSKEFLILLNESFHLALDERFQATLFDELSYRMNTLTTKQCMKALLSARASKHFRNVTPTLQSLLCWRIVEKYSRQEWPSKLTKSVLLELTSSYTPFRLQALRECILSLIQGIQTSDMDLEFATIFSWRLSNLDIYSPPWFSLCGTLTEAFTQADADSLAIMLESLARLRCASLVEALNLFPLVSTVTFSTREALHPLHFSLLRFVLYSSILCNCTDDLHQLYNDFSKNACHEIFVSLYVSSKNIQTAASQSADPYISPMEGRGNAPPHCLFTCSPLSRIRHNVNDYCSHGDYFYEMDIVSKEAMLSNSINFSKYDFSDSRYCESDTCNVGEFEGLHPSALFFQKILKSELIN
ncbi:hypothetical protein IE077_003308 [Cardiosporidium cionae]|uniref:Uncharacterized protein n=1 Tax=Cardiosporidium cionae TaxID=476202 RepID=A0ABQ7JF32_9APIC|nr:hypothetical protein IE077_003308 [Cardiosporidium cionae]|eukprot:KAF8822621.1 hypothetical protein IE077_003308 [Cardiosporidium cionae]